MVKNISSNPMYYYISGKAGCEPCKTIYLCAPQKAALTMEYARAFAIASGWQRLAEEQEAILVVPVAKEGWKAEKTSLLMDIYQETKNRFPTQSGQAILGRAGSLWCWETILYLVGYEEGAVFAGNVLVSNPNMFAAAALINGTPDDYIPGEHPSSHWMVKEISDDYSVRNSDIPVHAWLFGEDERAAATAIDYFKRSCSQENPAEDVRFFKGSYDPLDQQLGKKIFEECFNHVIRWKNGPDGTLALVDSKEEFYSGTRYLRREVMVGEHRYDYFVHLPEGKTAEQVKGLPLLFTVHGRGEPAWMFTAKNGWDILADETQEFIVVSPDCPGNLWFILRDHALFGKIVDDMDEKYKIDKTRVYLTGFSNGAVMTREMACLHPELFAAVSPSNAPRLDSCSMQLENASKLPMETSNQVRSMMKEFETNGWELPCAFFYGDNDPAARAEENPVFDMMLRANQCGQSPVAVYNGKNYFTKEDGYLQGARFHTQVYGQDAKGPMVCVTVMKNMPHGAIAEESRFAWNFMKRFKRENRNKIVDVLE